MSMNICQDEHNNKSNSSFGCIMPAFTLVNSPAIDVYTSTNVYDESLAFDKTNIKTCTTIERVIREVLTK